MKTSLHRNTVMFLVLFLGSFVQSFAHKEPTHQYIIREAYKLLKLQLGKPIPEFEKHIMGVGITGVNGNGNEAEFDRRGVWEERETFNGKQWIYILKDPWSYLTVPGGAWSEDQHDPVQHKDNDGYEIPFIGDSREAYTSVSHFWNPDITDTRKDDNEEIVLTLPWNPWPTGLGHGDKCAMARTYLSDYKTDLMAYRKALIYNGDNASIEYKFRKNGISYFAPGYRGTGSPISWYLGNMSYPEHPVNDNDKKEVIYNIIGRISHLLGDMSVPAHVHIDEHGIWHDPYEDAMNYKAWNHNKYSCEHDGGIIPASTSRVEYWYAKKIFEEKGGIINPYCFPEGKNPLWFLFYTTAQIADHFASNRFGGDDNFQHVGEIESIINDDYNSNHPGPTTQSFIDGNPGASGYSRADADLNAIRDATFPYVIRATAGLLYYYALEFGLLTDGSFPTVCPKEISLQNLEIKGNNYFFKAKEQIQAGFNVNPDNTTGNFVVNSAAKNVVIRAGNEIAFRNGFEAKAGSQVHAYIAGCDNCTTEELNPVITQRNNQTFNIKRYEKSENFLQLPKVIQLGTNVMPSFVISGERDVPHVSYGGSCCGKSGIIKVVLTNSLGHNLIEIADSKGDLSEYEIEEMSKKFPTGSYTFTVENSNGYIERRNIYNIQR